MELVPLTLKFVAQGKWSCNVKLSDKRNSLAGRLSAFLFRTVENA